MTNGCILPSIEDEIRPSLKRPAQNLLERKPKRTRHTEFDESGDWTDVRRFDRMPVTTEDAKTMEEFSGAPLGIYFVSLERKRIQGMIQLHERWIHKVKNKKSGYADIQESLKGFVNRMLSQFDEEYRMFVVHPMFNVVGTTRRRGLKKTIIK
jgi:hypothetical protein